MPRSIVVLIAALVSNPANAAVVRGPSFETSLGRFEFLIQRSVAGRKSAAAGSLETEANDARAVALEASQLRSFVDEVRFRASADPRDPSLLGELSFLAQSLNSWISNVSAVEQEVSTTEAAVPRDRTLIEPAEALEAQASLADSESAYLSMEAQAASFAFSAAGYGAQAFELQEYAQAGAQAAAQIHEDSRLILLKVQ